MSKQLVATSPGGIGFVWTVVSLVCCDVSTHTSAIGKCLLVGWRWRAHLYHVGIVKESLSIETTNVRRMFHREYRIPFSPILINKYPIKFPDRP